MNNFLESREIQETIKHPVHLINKEGILMQTAMVPFCEFGGNMSVMGVKIDQFDSPVCSSFKDKILLDQFCYTVDPNEYINFIDKDTELSLTLFISYNEDRQLIEKEINNSKKIESYLNETSVIVNTIGKG